VRQNFVAFGIRVIRSRLCFDLQVMSVRLCRRIAVKSNRKKNNEQLLNSLTQIAALNIRSLIIQGLLELIGTPVDSSLNPVRFIEIEHAGQPDLDYVSDLTASNSILAILSSARRTT
jgi:hypothetical protein